MAMKYFIYVIQNLKGKIYIGQTQSVQKRLKEHNESGVGYTSKFRPWKLKHSESFPTRAEAMQREKYLKKGVGRDWIKRKLSGA